jgi:hypothetical protein
MFRPLRAIFRWNINWLLPKELFFLQRVRSCFGYQVYIYIYEYYRFLFWLFFRRCLYVCGGYDGLLLLLHFSVLSYYTKIN